MYTGIYCSCVVIIQTGEWVHAKEHAELDSSLLPVFPPSTIHSFLSGYLVGKMFLVASQHWCKKEVLKDTTLPTLL